MRRRLLSIIVGLGVFASPVLAQSYFFSPDVPTDVGAATLLPWQIVRSDAAVYSVILTLPVNTPIDGLHAMDAGDWLISVEATTELPPGSGTFFDPRDVLRTDGLLFADFFCGDLVGIPAGSNVDSVFNVGGDDSGELVIGFDVPTDLTGIGGGMHGPADLVLFKRVGPLCGNWVFSGVFLDATTTVPPVQAEYDVTGADDASGATKLAFDVPSTLGATFLPGQIVNWNGVVFASFAFDPLWPVSSRADALSCVANPGSALTSLRVDKSTLTPGDLTLHWSASCSIGGEDYGIYEGTLASVRLGVYDHTRIDCSDALGDLTEEVTPIGADAYYILVANNATTEGSYGTDFDFLTTISVERPVGAAVCRSLQDLASCP